MSLPSRVRPILRVDVNVDVDEASRTDSDGLVVSLPTVNTKGFG